MIGMNGIHEVDQIVKVSRDEALGVRQVQTVHEYRGQRISRFCFASVIYMHPDIVNQHDNEVSKGEGVKQFVPNISEHRQGICNTTTGVAVAFLDIYGEDNAVVCLKGRGSTAERPMKLL